MTEMISCRSGSRTGMNENPNESYSAPAQLVDVSKFKVRMETTELIKINHFRKTDPNARLFMMQETEEGCGY